MKTQQAFTLVEIMVALAVVAILAMVALPNMQSTLLNNRITAKTNEFISAINYLRTESILRNNLIQIQPGLDDNGVFKFYPTEAALSDLPTNNEWGDGWRIWVDIDNDGNVDEATDIVRLFEFSNDGIVIDQRVLDINIHENTPIISYRTRGRVQKQYQFVLCHPKYSQGVHIITIERIGRVSSEQCALGEAPCPASCG